MPPADLVDNWLQRLLTRHTADLSRTEFLKCVRALSSRYVEERAQLTRRTPTDSAGKRAAFSGFYAPLHFLTTREVVKALGAADGRVRTIVDLGCGTGVASAAWAISCNSSPQILGVDKQAWALTDAAWNWRTLGCRGRTERADLVERAETLSRLRGREAPDAIVLGWSVNELDPPGRQRLLLALVALARQGAAVLIIEPLARGVTPWWDEWARVWRAEGASADEWKFDVVLPSALSDLSEAAGFRRESLGARTLWIRGTPPA